MTRDKVGEYLLEVLSSRGMSIDDLARAIDYSPQKIRSIIKEESELTIETACKLHIALDVPVDVWLGMQLGD